MGNKKEKPEMTASFTIFLLNQKTKWTLLLKGLEVDRE
jgi:hypothetical protein